MEPLTLLAFLVAIICAGYIVLHIVFNILSTVVSFVQANRFTIVVILLVMLVIWLGYSP
jgi:hypothetical protein